MKGLGPPYRQIMQFAVREGSRLEAWGTSPADAALAVVLTVVVISDFGPQWVAEPLVARLIGVPVLLSLAWRRRFPVPVATAVCALGLALAVTAPGQFPPQFYFFAVLVAVYSCAAWTAGRQAVLGGAITFSLITVGHVLTGDGDAGDFLPWLVWGAPWFAGRLVRRRTLEATASARRAAQLEQQRDAAVREAAAQERDRIARELHDVLRTRCRSWWCKPARNGWRSATPAPAPPQLWTRSKTPDDKRSPSCGPCSPYCATGGKRCHRSLRSPTSTSCPRSSSSSGRPACPSSSE